MHELSIAMSIVEGAAEEVERQGGGRVSAVHLKLGPLSGVAKEALLFSYDLACEGTILEGSTLIIEDMPVCIYCPECRAERHTSGTGQMQCDVCGHTADHVLCGAELELSALELIT